MDISNNSISLNIMDINNNSISLEELKRENEELKFKNEELENKLRLYADLTDFDTEYTAIYPVCDLCDYPQASLCDCMNINVCYKCRKDCIYCIEIKREREKELYRENKNSLNCVYCKQIKKAKCYHCLKLCCTECFGKNPTYEYNTGLSVDLLYNVYCSDCIEFNPDV